MGIYLGNIFLKRIFIAFFLISLLSNLQITAIIAQESEIPLIIYGMKHPNKELPKEISSKTNLTQLLQHVSEKQIEAGFLSFSIDSVVTKPDSVEVYINEGLPYFFGRICSNDSLNLNNKKTKPGKPFSPKQLKKIENELLARYQNNGFPFTSITKETQIKDQIFDIKYSVNSGGVFYFDSIQLIGERLISSHFLQQKTGIKPGNLYNKKLVEQAPKIINLTGFIKVDSFSVSYPTNKTTLTLKLSNQQQNSFAGIVGIQTKKKTEITGEVDLLLINSFKKGELLNVKWQKFSSLSQDLFANFKLPYIHKSPVGLMAELRFYKQDSTYSKTDLLGGIMVPTGKNLTIGITLHKNTTTANTKITYDLSNSTTWLYGLNMIYNSLNNHSFPTKGLQHISSIEFGNKKSLSTSDKENTSTFTQSTIFMEVFFNVPFGAFELKNESSFMFSDSLHVNNLYRLGGFSSFRGVNEKSIYAQNYSYFTLAYRLKIGSQSYSYLFADLGWFKEPKLTKYTLVPRQALGLGINLSTKAGIISIAYAIGNSSDEPFNISKAKVHIGYKNRF